MSVTVYVPNDSAAIGLGANATAQAISKIAAERGISIRLIRNGSRGLFWLEPFVEVVTTEDVSATDRSKRTMSRLCSMPSSFRGISSFATRRP